MKVWGWSFSYYPQQGAQNEPKWSECIQGSQDRLEARKLLAKVLWREIALQFALSFLLHTSVKGRE